MASGLTEPRREARKFFGLSRMTHSILDVAHPAVGALLVLGAFPPAATVALGLVAAFAGYTAVFALNDVMDYRVDCEKMAKTGGQKECFDIDSMGYRHPLAQGVLSWRAGLIWVIVWGLVSLVSAFLLRPLCGAIMVAAMLLEIGYCRLLRVTHWKGILSGSMVAVGGLAGVIAVTTAPPLLFVVAFFVWAFAWEVGCRNIPNDWSDIEEDASLGIRTVPVRYGRRVSSRISFGLLCLTVAASLVFPLVVAVRHAPVYYAAAAVAGIVLLLEPALRWVHAQTEKTALRLFNRACFYPLAVCGIVTVLVLV